MNPPVYAAKQHLHKYRQALLRTLYEVTARDIAAPSIFEPAASYTDSWHEVGELALLVWQLSALASDRFDAHPQWEAVANETMRFLAEHCAGCGKRLAAPVVRFCPDCLTALDAPLRHALQDSEVARQIAAYLADQDPTGSEDDA
ncbi:hypothetical protein [Chloracidobacterium aggregatum]|uniref:Zinc ribbon domain-containing protein n=1 Tax=Chloracidobacterium sp. N TaxID=2821540 RepID=A0ABX8B0U5_9BACT|nr:hypothetical protein [Chloracidobacterium aggregatum]QUV85083.1 hypothetical protein J8C03_02010 [Chloracidobacterium sp. 2]QUV88517.1 hypothetical protein J8C07_04135 [Chloracidobacterium sp. S]QUV91440.1 hypothetical protein J8C04_03275 [Chloracidobacterium sp. A]QUV94615.1 hypothetical protein J8C05_03990 [Chloracidobacterium sp. N]QUV97818.1 hypothetical protein J8C00_05070 [Chloracidobacterium sp. E]